MVADPAHGQMKKKSRNKTQRTSRCTSSTQGIMNATLGIGSTVPEHLGPLTTPLAYSKGSSIGDKTDVALAAARDTVSPCITFPFTYIQFLIAHPMPD